MLKTLNKPVIEGTHIDLIKTIYDNPTANIIVNDENLKAVFLRPGSTKWYSLSLFLLNIVLDSSQSNQARKESKRYLNHKGGSKLFLPMTKFYI